MSDKQKILESLQSHQKEIQAKNNMLRDLLREHLEAGLNLEPTHYAHSILINEGIIIGLSRAINTIESS